MFSLLVRFRILPLLLAGGLAACSAQQEEPNLLNVRANTSGPDEFAILPTKPLEQPADYAALPPPDPDAGNLADPTPLDDAYAALGGSADAVTRGSEPGLVAYAARFGVRPGIRDELAEADLDYRRENRGKLLERIFDVNVYYRVYEPYSLDQYAELERLRASGVRTPAVPPPPGG